MMKLYLQPIAHIEYFACTNEICNSYSFFSKGDDTDIITNYRLISILPVFSNVLEKAMLKRIDVFFSKHSLLNDSRFGFLKGRSMKSALCLKK